MFARKLLQKRRKRKRKKPQKQRQADKMGNVPAQSVTRQRAQAGSEVFVAGLAPSWKSILRLSDHLFVPTYFSFLQRKLTQESRPTLVKEPVHYQLSTFRVLRAEKRQW